MTKDRTFVPEGVLIQGHTIDSDAEFFVARAADELDIEYKFKYNIGAIGSDGWVEVDFVFYTPLPQPTEVMSEYYHPEMDSFREENRMSAIFDHFRQKALILNADEINSVEDAIDQLKENIL